MRRLASLVARLERDGEFVTLDDILAAGRRSMRTVPSEALARLVADAVADSLLLKDRRTFFDRRDGSVSVEWVYRVNARHPIVREAADDEDA
jgi:hypothetical protein